MGSAIAWVNRCAVEGVQVTRTKQAYDQLSEREKAAVRKFWKLQKAIQKDWEKFKEEFMRPV